MLPSADVLETFGARSWQCSPTGSRPNRPVAADQASLYAEITTTEQLRSDCGALLISEQDNEAGV